jgi:hypothetical protein
MLWLILLLLLIAWILGFAGTYLPTPSTRLKLQLSAKPGIA